MRKEKPAVSESLLPLAPLDSALAGSLLHSFNRLWKMQNVSWAMEAQILLLVATQPLSLKQRDAHKPSGFQAQLQLLILRGQDLIQSKMSLLSLKNLCLQNSDW